MTRGVTSPARVTPRQPQIRALFEPNSCGTQFLAEQHDEWTEGRRYLGLHVLARARHPPEQDRHEEVTDLKPLSA